MPKTKKQRKTAQNRARRRRKKEREQSRAGPAHGAPVAVAAPVEEMEEVDWADMGEMMGCADAEVVHVEAQPEDLKEKFRKLLAAKRQLRGRQGKGSAVKRKMQQVMAMSAEHGQEATSRAMGLNMEDALKQARADPKTAKMLSELGGASA